MRVNFKRGLAITLSTAITVLGMAVAGQPAIVAEAAEKYELIWSDEFEGNSLNRSNWNVEVNGYGGWNDELQYYCDSPENIIVSDGTLKIRAIKKDYLGKEYTSARLNSQGKAEFQFGKIEARMKLPCFKGAWPAFWMLGANGQMWPACGEIDIVETVNDESIVYGTAHWAKGDSYASSGSSTWAANARVDITQWHTYGIEWDANKIVWYVDDIKYHVVDISSDPNKASLALPQYLLLNLAVGGEWPGFNIDNNALPATMEIDYVRAYKQNENIVTTTKKQDSVANYQGTWNNTVGSWAGVAGTTTSESKAQNGFRANLSSVGSDMWGAQSSLPNIDYVAGQSYTFKCTMTSNVNKNVFVKVEGDNYAELAADYVSLKANQPYNYETTVYIPNTYNGAVSLFYAYGGGVNGETISSSSAMNLNVSNVEFYTEVEVDVEDSEPETPQPEEPKPEIPQPEEPQPETPQPEEPKPEEPEVPTDAPAWSASAVYTQGNKVTYNGKIYEASWWNQGTNPESQGAWGPWKLIGTASGDGTQGGNTGSGGNAGNEGIITNVPAWNASAVYNGGDKVSYNGKIYQASWWNQGTNPESSGAWGPWKLIG